MYDVQIFETESFFDVHDFYYREHYTNKTTLIIYSKFNNKFCLSL